MNDALAEQRNDPKESMATIRAALWTRLESALDAIYVRGCEISALQRLLGKKRDGVSHVLFIELLEEKSGRVLKKPKNRITHEKRGKKRSAGVKDTTSELVHKITY